jgi:hypothetical protein
LSLQKFDATRGLNHSAAFSVFPIIDALVLNSAAVHFYKLWLNNKNFETLAPIPDC